MLRPDTRRCWCVDTPKRSAKKRQPRKPNFRRSWTESSNAKNAVTQMDQDRRIEERIRGTIRSFRCLPYRPGSVKSIRLIRDPGCPATAAILPCLRFLLQCLIPAAAPAAAVAAAVVVVLLPAIIKLTWVNKSLFFLSILRKKYFFLLRKNF